MSHTALIEGVITLTAPLHVSSFDARQPFQAINADRNANASRMMSMPLAMAAPVGGRRAAPAAAADVDDEDFVDAMLADEDESPMTTVDASGRPVLIPFVPGNSIRGRIRTACSDLLLAALANNAQAITDRHYYSIRKGRASVSGAKEASNLEVIMQAQQDVFTGLFGLETKLPSTLRTPDWIPLIGGYTTRMVPEAFHADAVRGITPRQLYYLYTMRSVDDLQSGRDRFAEGVWAGGRQGMIDYVAARAEAVATANAARSDAKRKKAAGEAAEPGSEAKKLDFNNIFGYECLLPLTPLYGRVSVGNAARPEHVGLALAGMKALLEEQGLGGVSRLGFGSFDARFNVTIDGDTHVAAMVCEDGVVKIAAPVQALIDQASAALGGMTSADIAALHGVLTKVEQSAEAEDA